MQRLRLSFAIALLVGVFLAAGSAVAQTVPEPTNYQLRTDEANDLQTSTLTASGWLSAWVKGGFGSFSVYGWGRAPLVRPGYVRASFAVLRERRGLLR